MKHSRKDIISVIEVVLDGGYHSAVKIMSPTQVTRATRVLYDGKITKGDTKIVLTLGGPNYLEREFIAKCKKAGEPFPVKKIQVRKLPVKRNG